MKQTTKKLIWNYFLIILGTGLMAVSIAGIYDAAGIVTGGFSGISIMVKDVSKAWIPGGVPLGLTMAVLNIPVFLICYLKFGKKFIGRTLFGTACLSVWLSVVPQLDLFADDLLLVALFGGAFSGVGFGLVLRAGATTGGTDMVASLIRLRLRYYSVIQIMQIVDGAIVLAGLYVFGLRPTLYAIVAIFVTTKVTDAFLEGFRRAKAAMIITNEYEQVAKMLMEKLDRGVTALSGKGMYTGNEKTILYCVVSKKEIVYLKEMVHSVDSDAFVIVSDVTATLGEGFLEHNA